MPQLAKVGVLYERLGEDAVNEIAAWLDQVYDADAVLHFDLNHQPIRLIGKQKSWPHPQEWLKRTIGDDWLYYSTGGYTGVFETTG